MESCGGCPLLALTNEQERSSKLELLQQLQSRLGLSRLEPELDAWPMRVGYRNRVRLRVDEFGRIVFFNAHKSANCAALMPTLREHLDKLRHWSRLHPQALTTISHLEVRTQDSDGLFGVFLTALPGYPNPVGVVEELSSLFPSQVVATNLDPVAPTQRFPIDNETFQRVPLDGFLQVNFNVNRLLIEHVLRAAKRHEVHTFADLYSGSGNFTLPLAKAGLTGTSVESVASAVTAAQMSAGEQGHFGVEFHHGDARDRVRAWFAEGRSFDLVLIDPPRAGVRSGLEAIAKLARRSIAYCSCNPKTLERDLSILQRIGWQLDRITGFDMFPGTRHLEVLAWLSR